MDGQASSAQSEVVLEVVHAVVESIGSDPSRITEQMVRKVAHFVSFALFGVFLIATLQSWFGRLRPYIFMGLFFGLLIAVTDEFIQLYIDGRSSLVEDVVLDL